MRPLIAQLLAAGVGICSTTNAAVNSSLAKVSGHALFAAFVSYVISAAFLVALSAHAARRAGVGLFVFSRKPQPRELSGGLLGAGFLATALFITPLTGVSLFFSLVVAGQLSVSLAIDKYGFLDFKPKPVGGMKVVCVALALLGAAISSIDEMSHAHASGAGHAPLVSALISRAVELTGNATNTLALTDVAAAGTASAASAVGAAASPVALRGHAAASAQAAGSSADDAGPLMWLILPAAVLAGAVQPVQAAINSRLGSLLPHRLQAAALSLVVALAACTGLVALALLTGPISRESLFGDVGSGSRWWMWGGGLCIAGVVSGGVFLPSRIGAAQYYTFLLAGELVASLLFDSVGAFGLRQRPCTFARTVAVLLVLLAAGGQGGLSCSPAATAEAGAAAAPVASAAAADGAKASSGALQLESSGKERAAVPGTSPSSSSAGTLTSPVAGATAAGQSAIQLQSASSSSGGGAIDTSSSVAVRAATAIELTPLAATLSHRAAHG